jgi:hypothetical protein
MDFFIKIAWYSRYIFSFKFSGVHCRHCSHVSLLGYQAMYDKRVYLDVSEKLAASIFRVTEFVSGSWLNDWWPNYIGMLQGLWPIRVTEREERIYVLVSQHDLTVLKETNGLYQVPKLWELCDITWTVPCGTWKVKNVKSSSWGIGITIW